MRSVALYKRYIIIRCILSVLVCFCLHNVANCQRIQWSNTRNLWSSFRAYDHHCIYLSQERLTPSWITACFISITPKCYKLVPSLSLLAAVLYITFVSCWSRNVVITTSYFSRYGYIIRKGKKKEKKIIMMMMMIVKNSN